MIINIKFRKPRLFKVNSFFSFSCLALFLLSFYTHQPIYIQPNQKNLPNQNTDNILIKGIILDKVTNEPVPHANIGVVANKAYIRANDNGVFTLTLKPEQTTGKVSVSSLGYTSQVFSVADLIKQNAATKEVKLFLAPDYKNLKVVEVNAKTRKWKAK